MKKILLSGALVTLSLLGASGVAAVEPPATKDETTEVEVEVDSTLTIESEGRVEISVMPTEDGTLGTGSDVVEVHTNSAAGYVLSIKTAGSQTALMPTNADNNKTIAAATGTVDNPAALNKDTWGYRINSFSPNAYAGVTDEPAQIKETGSSAVAGDITVITYGANVSTATTDGTYTNTIVYTATNNS